MTGFVRTVTGVTEAVSARPAPIDPSAQPAAQAAGEAVHAISGNKPAGSALKLERESGPAQHQSPEAA
jgi:hypothetical protein